MAGRRLNAAEVFKEKQGLIIIQNFARFGFTAIPFFLERDARIWSLLQLFTTPSLLRRVNRRAACLTAVRVFTHFQLSGFEILR
jgi:hypothetical protein